MRIQPGENTRAGLAATGLGDKGPIEPHALAGKAVEVWRPGVRVAVAAQFRAVVLGDDQQDVRPSARRRGVGGLRRGQRWQQQEGQDGDTDHESLNLGECSAFRE